MYTMTQATIQQLTKFFVGYRKQNYIAESILIPKRDVPKRGKIFVGGDAHLSILGVATPRTLPAPELDVRSAFVEFDLDVFRRKITVTDEEAADWDLPLTPIKHATSAIKENLNVEREYALSAYMTTSGNFTNTSDPATVKWGAVGGGDAALADIDTAISTIGHESNLIGVFSFDVYRTLKRQWQQDLREAGQKDPMSLQAMAAYAGLDACVVGSAYYNTASDPDNPSLSRLWGSGNAWIVRVADSDGESSHCFGVSATRNPSIQAKRIDDPDGTKVIGKMEFADVVIDELYAYYFTNCLS